MYEPKLEGECLLRSHIWLKDMCTLYQISLFTLGQFKAAVLVPLVHTDHEEIIFSCSSNVSDEGLQEHAGICGNLTYVCEREFL